jgi:hypothetical protein
MIFGGGTGPSQPIFDDVWEYDGTTWQQISPAVTPSARVASCMVTDSGQSRVLMFGGGQWQNPFENDTWSYANNAFVQLSPANSPPPLQSANCAYDEWRGRVVLQGGSTSQVPLTFTNATWELDGNTWNDVTPSNGPGQTCCSIMATNPGGRGVMLLTTDGETWTFEPPAVP